MAGSATVKKNTIRNGTERIEEYVFSWIGDAANGSVPNTSTDLPVTGWVFMGESDPGTPAPTADYDLTVIDDHSVDVFGAELADRSASLTEQATPKIGSAYGERFVDSILTMTVANQAVNSAQGVLRVFVRKGQT